MLLYSGFIFFLCSGIFVSFKYSHPHISLDTMERLFFGFRIVSVMVITNNNITVFIELVTSVPLPIGATEVSINFDICNEYEAC